MGKRFVIIGNPIAGGGAREKIARALSILRASGVPAELKLTSQKGDAEAFARDASMIRDAVVIAAGGDGTYNETANGLANSNTPMAILPMGTTSVLARELGIPSDTERALDIATNGTVQRVHLGKISCLQRKAAPDSLTALAVHDASRYFLLMTGMGYDGESVYRVSERLKKYSGKLAYIISGIGVIIKYHPGLLSIKAAIADSRDLSGGRLHINTHYCSVNDGILMSTGYTVIVSKAACYGGDMKITPDASLTSPYLYVFISHRKSRLNLLNYLMAIISGRAAALGNTSYFRTSRIEIYGDSHIQMDGDYAGKTPAQISIAENALGVIVPK